jgi:hypothetical protein
MWVGGLEVDKVLELLNGRLLHGKEPEAYKTSMTSSSNAPCLLTSLALDVVALNGWGSKAVCAQSLADIGGV